MVSAAEHAWPQPLNACYLPHRLYVLGRAGVGPGLHFDVCFRFFGQRCTQSPSAGCTGSFMRLPADMQSFGHAVRSPLGWPLADGSVAIREQRSARRLPTGLMVRCLRPSGRNRPGSITIACPAEARKSRVSWNAPGQSIVPGELDIRKTMAQAASCGSPFGKGKNPCLFGAFEWVVVTRRVSDSLACFRLLADACLPLQPQREQRREQTRAPTGKQSQLSRSEKNVKSKPHNT